MSAEPNPANKSPLLTFPTSSRTHHPMGAMTIMSWLNSREVFIATAMILLSLTIGIVGESLLMSVLVAVMVAGFASGVWAIRVGADRNELGQRMLGAELTQFRTELGAVGEVLGSLANVRDVEVLDHLTEIATDIAKVREHDLLFNIVKHDIGALARRLSERSGADTYNVRARKSPAEVDAMFRTCVDSVGPGWTMECLTNLRFWSSETLESPSDLLDANAEAARRGGQIRRILVIPGEYQFNSEEVSILVAQWELTQRYENVETLVATPQSHESFEDLGVYSICTPPKGKNPVLVEMHYGRSGTPDANRFERLEVVVDMKRVARRKSRIERLWPRAVPLDTCLRALLPDIDPGRSLNAGLESSPGLLSH